MRLPPRNLVLFEVVINAIRKTAPSAAIAFNTRPDDRADAAACPAEHDSCKVQLFCERLRPCVVNSLQRTNDHNETDS